MSEKMGFCRGFVQAIIDTNVDSREPIFRPYGSDTPMHWSCRSPTLVALTRAPYARDLIALDLVCSEPPMQNSQMCPESSGAFCLSKLSP